MAEGLCYNAPSPMGGPGKQGQQSRGGTGHSVVAQW